MPAYALSIDEPVRQSEILKCKLMFDEIVSIDDSVCAKAAGLKFSAHVRVPMIDALIAAVAALGHATLVHRDPHFLAISPTFLTQEMLPQK